MNFPTPGAEARAYGKRGGKAASALNKVRIEGVYYTQVELAKVVGCSEGVIGTRLKRLRMASGPITIERLRA